MTTDVAKINKNKEKQYGGLEIVMAEIEINTGGKVGKLQFSIIKDTANMPYTKKIGDLLPFK